MNDLRTPANPIVLHLIHGTWSDGRDWVRDDSPFRTFLKNKFGPSVTVNVVSWSGRNRDADRQQARNDVVQVVKRFHALGVRQFLIGHSHGGNVAAYAASDPAISNLIAGVVCLSTPFISVLPREFIRRALSFAALLAFGPMCLIADWLWQTIFGKSNDVVRFGITIVFLVIAMRLFRMLAKAAAIKSSEAAKRSPSRRADSVKMLALSSGEDEALSGLALLENFSVMLRLLQHPAIVLVAAAGCMALLAMTHVLPSPILPGSGWVVSEAWTYVAGAVLMLALLEALITAFCWRIGLGLAWKDFPMGSSFFTRVMLTPVPLNFSQVEFRSLELDGSSLLAHCRIYTDDAATLAVANWIEKQASPAAAGNL